MAAASSPSPAPPSPTKASRLVRFLVELLDTDAPVSHQRFIERLGQSFDLADSIKISAVHDKRVDTGVFATVSARDAVRDEFERVRASIVSTAMASFVPGADSIRLRFPGIGAGLTKEQSISPEPYVAYYIAQQRNIDFNIRNLHASTRDALIDLSPQLAQLAALDAVLADPLSATVRRSFAAVPRLLRQRLEALLQDHRIEDHQKDEPEPGNERERQQHNLGQLRAEMQGLLLAEIETRLLPTLGLIEALDDTDDD